MEKIKKLIKYLPAKDISIAEKLLDKRDFDELSMLVSSDMENLIELSNEIDKYTTNDFLYEEL